MKIIFTSSFLFIFSLSLTAQETLFKKRNPLPVTPLASGSVCSCLIPLDNTFTIAEFDSMGGNGGPGLPPEYRNDDWCTAMIPLPFAYCLFGQSYNSVIINNNGNISFNSVYSTFTANSFPDSTFTMVAPFWADADTRGLLSGLVYYKITPSSMIIKWDHVGYYNAHDSLLNTFQVIITNGSDPMVPYGNTAFCYGDMQWTTGEASSGVNGFGGNPATVGANKGNGIDYIQFGRFDQAGYAYDGSYGFNDGVDWLDSSNFIFDLCPANVPPVATDCMNDTVPMLVGNTSNIDFAFMAPELGQASNITLQNTSLSNFSVVNNTFANYAQATALIIPSAADIGYHTINVSVTDNGLPPATATYDRVVQVISTVDVTSIEPLPVSVFPNPAQDESVFSLGMYPFQNVKLRIMDITGREILVKNFESPSVHVSEKEIGSGVFIYRISNGEGMERTGKLVMD